MRLILPPEAGQTISRPSAHLSFYSWNGWLPRRSRAVAGLIDRLIRWLQQIITDHTASMSPFASVTRCPPPRSCNKISTRSRGFMSAKIAK